MPDITHKQAVRTAYNYLVTAAPDPTSLSKFILEEIKQDKSKDFLITLSYEETGKFQFENKRVYKDFKVKKDGAVEWMKIRKL